MPMLWLALLITLPMRGEAMTSVSIPPSTSAPAASARARAPQNEPENDQHVASVTTALTNPYPQLARAYYVQLNDEPLWGQAITDRLPPASLTKLMTALLVQRHGELSQRVTVSATAAGMKGARLGLKKGQQISRQDLLTAMLLGSGNDACVALAESVAGSEAAFVAQMNAEAKRLQLTDTAFKNACGFDADSHYSSVRDLVHLTEQVLAEPALMQVVARAEATVTIDGKHRAIKSSNALLGRLPGAIGVKTGFTNKAGKCVIALTERNGDRVLAVFLNAPDRWWDLAAVIELAFREARSRQHR